MNDANEQKLTVAKGYKRKFESMTPQRATALACVRKNSHLALPEKRQVYKKGKKQDRAPQPVRFPAPPPRYPHVARCPLTYHLPCCLIQIRFFNKPEEQKLAHLAAARSDAGAVYKTAAESESEAARVRAPAARGHQV